MDKYVSPEAFKACYAQFERADADRNILFTQLLEGYEALRNENARVQEQLESEKETRIMWQDNARSSKKELNKTKLATVRNAALVPETLTTLTHPRKPTPLSS